VKLNEFNIFAFNKAPRLVRWFCGFFTQHQWARRTIGGKWQLWWVDPCTAFVWLKCDEFWDGNEQTRPGACWPNSSIFTSTEWRELPKCEDYSANPKISGGA
jgi:hypothetical protein